MQKPLIYALHGFLGEGSDWNRLKKMTDEYDWVCPSLFSQEKYNKGSFEDLVQVIQNDVKQLKSSRKVFVGYSFGGRIGLHILKFFPDLFDHYIFISTGAGLQDASDRPGRVISDQAWIKLLENASWKDFIATWNAQPVLAKSIEPLRHEIDFNRGALVNALSNLSLARQDDMRAVIKTHQSKIDWIVGEKDSKYLQMAEEMMQKKILLNYKRIFSGHRVLFEESFNLRSSLNWG